MTLGQAIQTIRKVKNISQIELSRRSKISTTSLSQIEKDRTWLSKKNLTTICVALDITAEDLFKVASLKIIP